MNSLRAESK